MSEVHAPYNLVRSATPLIIIHPMPEEIIPDRELERLNQEYQDRVDANLIEPDDCLDWDAALEAATGKNTAREIFQQIKQMINDFDTEQHTPEELDSLLTEIYQAAEYGWDAV